MADFIDLEEASHVDLVGAITSISESITSLVQANKSISESITSLGQAGSNWDWSSLVAALLGGVLALTGSFLATRQSREAQRKASEKENDRRLLAFLQALQTETTLIQKIYIDDFKNQIDKCNKDRCQLLLLSNSTIKDHMIVNSVIPESIGLIWNRNLRALILETYSTIKSFSDWGLEMLEYERLEDEFSNAQFNHYFIPPPDGSVDSIRERRKLAFKFKSMRREIAKMRSEMAKSNTIKYGRKLEPQLEELLFAIDKEISRNPAQQQPSRAAE